ncbi:MAG: hypothetical protein KJO31_11225 [Gammaproteobacteria bacterium]|nr:hypothetical protein [Gammaproteobacteria bacterium]
MKQHNWIEFVTAFAIVAGLVVVVWELRQSRALAEADLATQAYGQIQNYWQTLAGENPSQVLAKACNSPEELSDEETGIYWAVLQMQFFNMHRNIYVEAAGGFDTDVDEWVRSDMKYYLGSRLGRQEFDRFGDSWLPLMKRIATELIENDAVIPCEDTWRHLTDAMHSEADPRD